MKSHSWLLNPRSWALIPLLLVLVTAVACGSDAEPTPQSMVQPTAQPTPTPVDVAGIVQRAIAEQAAAQPAGVSAEDMAKAIERALAAQPGVSPEDVAKAIERALAAQPSGLTEEDLSRAVAKELAQALPSPTAMPAEPAATPLPGQGGPIFGGIAPMLLYAPPFGDFLWKGSAPTAVWADPVFNRLIEFNPETPELTDLRGDLAEEWSVAPDGLTYTFKLHENVKFQDGQPLTSDDVLFSFKMMTDCESIDVVKDVCPWTSGQLRLLGSYYESSRAIDSRTVELKTQFTAPAFLTNFSQGEIIVLPKHLIEAGIFPSSATPENMIGSGPFKMKKHTRDVGTEYEKNTDYFKDGYPKFDGMSYFIIRDKGTIIASFKTGQVLMAATVQNNLSFKDGLQLSNEMGDDAEFYVSGPLAGMGLMVNAKKPEFDNDEVRRAFMLIIHRQPIVATLSDGFYPMGFPIPPNLYWFSRTLDEVLEIPGFREQNGQKHPDDIAEAKQLFEKNGMGEGFKVAITCRTILEYCEMATLLADQFRRFLGWDPSVDAGDPVVNIGRFNDGDYELGIMANSCGFPDPDSCLTSAYALPTSGMRRRAHYTSDEIVDLSELQTREIDQEKRGALVRQAEELLLNGKNAFPYTHFLMSPVIVNNRIQNYHVPPAYSFQEKNEHLWCDPAC